MTRIAARGIEPGVDHERVEVICAFCVTCTTCGSVGSVESPADAVTCACCAGVGLHRVYLDGQPLVLPVVQRQGAMA